MGALLVWIGFAAVTMLKPLLRLTGDPASVSACLGLLRSIAFPSSLAHLSGLKFDYS